MMTGKIFGTLTFMAVISAVLAKFFSQLAFATPLPSQINPSDLAGDGQFLGQYEVVQETSKGKENGADLCPNKEKYGKAVNCGDQVWVFKKGNQIIPVYVPNQDPDDMNNNLMIWTVTGKHCEGGSDLPDAYSKGIFNLNLCGLSSEDSNSGPASAYNPMPTTDPLLRVVTFGLIGQGSEATTLSFSSDSNTIQVEDKFSGQGIDNKITLKKTAAISVKMLQDY